MAIPTSQMLRHFHDGLRARMLTGLSPLQTAEAAEWAGRLVRYAEDEEANRRQQRTAEELARNDAEQRDIDRRVAADMMRETDPDARCRPMRVPCAMVFEAERLFWEAQPDGMGTNAAIARIAGRVGR